MGPQRPLVRFSRECLVLHQVRRFAAVRFRQRDVRRAAYFQGRLPSVLEAKIVGKRQQLKCLVAATCKPTRATTHLSQCLCAQPIRGHRGSSTLDANRATLTRFTGDISFAATAGVAAPGTDKIHRALQKRPVRSRGVRLRRKDATTADGKRSALLTSKEHFCMNLDRSFR